MKALGNKFDSHRILGTSFCSIKIWNKIYDRSVSAVNSVVYKRFEGYNESFD